MTNLITGKIWNLVPVAIGRNLFGICFLEFIWLLDPGIWNLRKLNIQLQYPAIQGLSRYPQHPCGLRLVAAGGGQGCLDGFFLGRAQAPGGAAMGRKSTGGLQLDLQLVEMIEGERVALAKDQRPLHHVFQLPDIAGEIVPEHGVLYRRIQPGNIVVQLPGVPFDKMPEQVRDALAAITKGRDVDAESVQPVVQVGAELSLPRQPLDVLVGGGDHTDINGLQRGGTQPADLPVIHDAQQLGLQAGFHIGNLVQEKRSLVCDLEPPGLVGEGSRERTLPVAEKFAFE